MRPLLLIAALLATPALAAYPDETFGIPTDKVMHAALSANLDLGFTALCRAAGGPPGACLLIGAGVTLALGAAKELVWDWALHRGTPDPADFAFDVLGTGAGLVCSGVLIAHF